MGGIDYSIILWVTLYLFVVWGMGRAFRFMKLPAVLGEFLAGVLLGPEAFDVVPYASDGFCPDITTGWSMPQPPSPHLPPPPGPPGAPPAPPWSPGSSGSASYSASASGSHSSHSCKSILVYDGASIPDIWSFIGTVGVTLLIFESGMHINFGKVRQVGKQALVVAIVGTGLPLITGMVMTKLLDVGSLYPEGFAAGCALAPTSVGISIKLLDDAKMLNSMAGQTTLTAAFVDDVFSLILLVLLKELGNPDGADTGKVVIKTIFSFVFLGFGIVCANYIFPHLTRFYEKFPTSKSASLQLGDEAQLFSMLGWLVLCGYIGSSDLCGSHLLGAFVAGMSWVKVPRSHQIWTRQMKRIIKWTIRIFFSAAVGFAVPVQTMLTGKAFMNGLAMGVVPGVLGKIASGAAAKIKYPSDKHRVLAAQASPMTCGARYQPMQLLVGMAMVARGEFAFLVAKEGSELSYEGGRMMSQDVYSMVTWALVWALVLAPFLFKWALSVYQAASPVVRSSAIGGTEASGSGFMVRVVGKHHTGLLHEVLDVLHVEGVDVLESKMETDGANDILVFVVTSRGKQKDFDNEKLEDIRHHIVELVKDPNSQVLFEPISLAGNKEKSRRLQVELLSKHNPETLSALNSKMTEMGLVVQESGTATSTQDIHGHEMQMAHHMFYVSDKDGKEFSDDRCAAIRESLQPVLGGQHGGEAIVKMISTRTSFDDLSWMPEDSVKSAEDVWEVDFQGATDEGILRGVTSAFKTQGVNVTYSRVHRDSSSETLGAVYFIERAGGGKITPDVAESIRTNITQYIAGGDTEAASANVRIRPLKGRPRSTSIGDAAAAAAAAAAAVAAVDMDAEAMAKLQATAAAAGHIVGDRPETPVEALKPGEVGDEVNGGGGGRNTARVAPAPNTVEAEA